MFYDRNAELVDKIISMGVSKYRLAKDLHVSWNTVHLWSRRVWKPTMQNWIELGRIFDKLSRQSSLTQK